MSDAFRTRITIEAEPEQVFDHFVQPELLVRWMGDLARVEAWPPVVTPQVAALDAGGGPTGQPLLP